MRQSIHSSILSPRGLVSGVSYVTTHSIENDAWFVMDQWENIKELNSCTELCGDCISFFWDTHNSSHTLQEYNSVFSMHLCQHAAGPSNGTSLLSLGGGHHTCHSASHKADYTRHLWRGKDKPRVPAIQPLSNKVNALNPQSHVNCYGLKSHPRDLPAQDVQLCRSTPEGLSAKFCHPSPPSFDSGLLAKAGWLNSSALWYLFLLLSSPTQG